MCKRCLLLALRLCVCVCVCVRNRTDTLTGVRDWKLGWEVGRLGEIASTSSAISKCHRLIIESFLKRQLDHSIVSGAPQLFPILSIANSCGYLWNDYAEFGVSLTLNVCCCCSFSHFLKSQCFSLLWGGVLQLVLLLNTERSKSFRNVRLGFSSYQLSLFIWNCTLQDPYSSPFVTICFIIWLFGSKNNGFIPNSIPSF